MGEVLITIAIVGIVAALTIPALMTNIRRHVVETRLKHSYSLLNQVLKSAQAEYDEFSGWNMEQNVETFTNTYIIPYLKSNFKSKNPSTASYKILLINGTTWSIILYKNWGDANDRYNFVKIYIDINGDTKPNKYGSDIFIFYIFPSKRNLYNDGNGDVAINVPSEGIYPSGYGYSDTILTNKHNGKVCSDDTSISAYERYGYCTALIVKNNFKIPKNHPRSRNL